VAVAGIVVALGFGLRWWLAAPPTDEDQVRAAIESVVEGAGRGDVGATMASLSESYRSDEGEGLGYREVAGYLYLQFRRYGPATVLLGPVDVVVQGDAATATFDATIAAWGAGGGGLLPESADVWHLVVELRREDDEWRIVTHERSSASGR
jgi:hypothetical protein